MANKKPTVSETPEKPQPIEMDAQALKKIYPMWAAALEQAYFLGEYGHIPQMPSPSRDMLNAQWLLQNDGIPENILRVYLGGGYWQKTGILHRTGPNMLFSEFWDIHPIRDPWENLIRTLCAGVWAKGSEVEKGLSNYVLGFHKGYADFESLFVKPAIEISRDQKSAIRMVFEYAVTKQQNADSNYRMQFQIEHDNSGYRSPSDWGSTGVEHGRYYRAWCLILLDHTPYTDLFATLESLSRPDQKTRQTASTLEIDCDNVQVLPINIAPKQRINDLFDLMKDYIHESGLSRLLSALSGDRIDKRILWSGDQRLLAEIFQRMHYNNLIRDSKKRVAEWVAENFDYTDTKGQVNQCSFRTVQEYLASGSFKRAQILFEPEWLPYKVKSKRKSPPDDE